MNMCRACNAIASMLRGTCLSSGRSERENSSGRYNADREVSPPVFDIINLVPWSSSSLKQTTIAVLDDLDKSAHGRCVHFWVVRIVVLMFGAISQINQMVSKVVNQKN